MAFQPIAFQLNFQQLLDVEEDEKGVVLIPRYIRFRTKFELALYTLAVYAKDQAVRTPLTELFEKVRDRSTTVGPDPYLFRSLLKPHFSRYRVSTIRV